MAKPIQWESFEDAKKRIDAEKAKKENAKKENASKTTKKKVKRSK